MQTRVRPRVDEWCAQHCWQRKMGGIQAPFSVSPEKVGSWLLHRPSQAPTRLRAALVRAMAAWLQVADMKPWLQRSASVSSRLVEPNRLERSQLRESGLGWTVPPWCFGVVAHRPIGWGTMHAGRSRVSCWSNGCHSLGWGLSAPSLHQ